MQQNSCKLCICKRSVAFSTNREKKVVWVTAEDEKHSPKSTGWENSLLFILSRGIMNSRPIWSGLLLSVGYVMEKSSNTSVWRAGNCLRDQSCCSLQPSQVKRWFLCPIRAKDNYSFHFEPSFSPSYILLKTINAPFLSLGVLNVFSLSK